jgi:hypothetical protein
MSGSKNLFLDGKNLFVRKTVIFRRNYPFELSNLNQIVFLGFLVREICRIKEMNNLARGGLCSPIQMLNK